MDNGLKPCPFCGNTDVGLRDVGSYVGVWCERCGGQGGMFEYDQRDDAFNAWNMRASPWIHVSNPPKVHESVFACEDKDHIYVGHIWIDNGVQYWMEDQECTEIKPTHWMPTNPPSE